MSVPSVSHRAPLLSRRYVIESKLLSTISTDVFKAIGKDSSVPVTLLLVRQAIPVDHSSAANFAQRMRTLKSAGLSRLIEVGVDDEGKAFVVMPQLEGSPISSGRIEGAEAERRVLSAAKSIAKIHSLGLCCGDLTLNSWWVDRSGDVSLIAAAGIPGEPISTDSPIVGALPAAGDDPVWKELLAPEILAGSPATPSADVYSLAALGKKLLPQLLSSDKGAYLVPILAAASSPDPLLRPTSAGMLLEQIQLARSEVKPMLASRKSGAMTAGSKGASAGDGSRSMHVSKTPATQAPAEKPPSENDSVASESTSSRSRPVLVTVLGVLVIVSFLVGTKLASWHQKNENDRAGQEAQLEMVAGNTALEQAVRVLGSTNAPLNERQLQLEKLTNSDDPLAHELLVKTALGAVSEENRLLAERAIVERARRLGMMRSGEQGRTWLRGLKDNFLPTEYEPILRLLNANLPGEARLAFLKQVLAHDSTLATRLTAAEALDLESKDLTELLAQLVGERTKIEGTAGRPLLPLLLVDPELAALYGDDVIQRRDQLRLEDLTWVLPVLADRNDPAIRPLADLALEKSAISPIQAVFLELMRDRNDLSPEVLATLVRASTGKATISDIATLGRWVDTGAERALLALCATLPVGDPRGLEAFDTMAGRSGSIEPASSMVEWIRESRWTQREKFIQPVGVVSFADRMSRAELEEFLPKMIAVIREPGLLDVLVQHGAPEVSSLLVTRYGDKLGMGGLVNLLSHPEKQVRIAAIKGLKDVNEASILRLILERYQGERDADVIKAYKENFWVVRERG